MKIKIMSKGEIQNKIIPSNIAIINFYDYLGHSLVETQKHSICVNDTIIDLDKANQILSICADDIDLANVKLDNKSISIFTETQAKDIINFIIEHKYKTIVFQCDYGKSRSLSTAIFARDNLLKEHDFSHNEDVIRNQSFYNLLVKVYEN